jgi:hypothetical protein
MSKKVDEIILPFTNHYRFYCIAYKKYFLISLLLEKRNQISKKKKKTVADNDNVYRIQHSIQDNAMIAVIFSALTLEAFINNYGFEKLPSGYFGNLDKIDFISKWLIFPKLVTGRELNTSHYSFGMLKELHSLRNVLVHYKTYCKPAREITERDWVTERNAHRAIETVRAVAKELKKLDNKVDITWVERARILSKR